MAKVTELPNIGWEDGLRALVAAVKREKARKQSNAMQSMALCPAPRIAQTETFVALARETATALGIEQDRAELALAVLWATAAVALAPDRVQQPGHFVRFADSALNELASMGRGEQRPPGNPFDDDVPF